MDDEKNLKFTLFVIICSITITIEIFLFIWSNIQVARVDLNGSSMAAMQLACKAVTSFFAVLFGSWITTSVSLFIPAIKVQTLYNSLTDYKHGKFATMLLVLYWIVPIANTVYSISGSFLLLREAGISLFDVIASML